MNENIDLTKILKDCPKGWKLYSPLCGEVKFDSITENSEFPITVLNETIDMYLTRKGTYCAGIEGAECILFPSKDQRDWSKFTAPWYKKEKFDPKTLKPFDKVLVRNDCREMWKCNLFSHISEFVRYPYIVIENGYRYCIPFNNDTIHIAGTRKEAPEYYRYWED